MYSTPNCIINSFLPFSGGKFLSNCLALSKHACPQDRDAATYLLSCPDDYDYRLAKVLSTLPPSHRMNEWWSFEFNEQQLYGQAFISWCKGKTGVVNDITRHLSRSTLRFFVTDHSIEARNLVSIWREATIIRFINSRRFQELCLSKKKPGYTNTNIQDINGNYCQEKYQGLKGPDWPDWEDFDRQGYDLRAFGNLTDNIIGEMSDFYRVHLLKNPVILFDVDSCYFDIDTFQQSLQALYNKLGFTDYQPDLIKIFYEKYMQLHF